MNSHSMRQLPYQGLAPIYDYVMRHVDYDEWAAFIRDVFTRYAPETKHLIDLACGTGNVSSELSLLGFSITGADLSESMVRIAQEKAALRGDDSTFATTCARFRIGLKVLFACDSFNYLLETEDTTRRSTVTVSCTGRTLCF